MKRSHLAAVLVCLLALAGCGGHTQTITLRTVAPPVAATQACPPGQSQMGCATVKLTSKPQIPRPGSRPPGRIFPDVAVFQGHPDWAAAKSSIAGFVAKAGEYVEDIDYGYNADSAARLHIPFGAYWFVRNYGCAAEALRIEQTIGRHPRPAFVVLDMEVPEARGYTCLAGPVSRALKLPVRIYTAPGTWPGGSTAGLPVWVASYGPSRAPSTFGAPAAWQYTDGTFGAATRIPGVPLGDVSIDYGLFPKPKPPNPYAIYPTTLRHFAGGVTARESGTVRWWDRRHCRNPVRRAACRATRARLVLLRNRDVFVATHQPPRFRKPAHRYGRFHLDGRVHGMQVRLHQTRR